MSNGAGIIHLNKDQITELKKKLREKCQEELPYKKDIQINSYPEAETYRTLKEAIKNFNERLKPGKIDAKKFPVSEMFLRKIMHYEDAEMGYQYQKINLCYLYATGKSYDEYCKTAKLLASLKELFEREFMIWIGSGKQYNIPREVMTQLIEYALAVNLQPEEYDFVLHSAVYYGNETMIILTEKCKKDPGAVQMLFNSLVGRGVRVGWRAEYLFSHLDRHLIGEYFRSLPEPFRKTEPWKACMTRILNNQNDQTWEYLQEFANGVDPKLRSYANEVMVQINNARLKYKEPALAK